MRRFSCVVGSALACCAAFAQTSVTNTPPRSDPSVEVKPGEELAKPQLPGGGIALPCDDFSAPNADLGVIGPTPWYSISGDCSVDGKWYASFSATASITYHWDLCSTDPGTGTSNFDSDIKICDAAGTILAGVDGLSSCSPAWNPNNWTWVAPASQTYYVVIAPYRSYNQHNCTGSDTTTFTLEYYAEVSPCPFCDSPNADLGDVPGSATQVSSDCGTNGKWYAKFNGYAGVTYHWDLCPNAPGDGTSSFDADVKILDSSCAILAGVDGLSSCSPVAWNPNDFQWTCPSDGTYYVVVAPYNSYASHTCNGTSSDTFTLEYYADASCLGNEPPNDNCGDVAPFALDTSGPVVRNGDNTCATNDCSQLSAYKETWEAFTTAETLDVKIEYCGTSPAHARIYIVLADGCPCGTLVFASAYNFVDCGDTNATLSFFDLPAGTYYYPVLMNPGESLGPYTLTFSATEPPPYCRAGATTTSCFEHLSNVELGSINNASACSAPGSNYSDYTGISTTMTIGVGETLTLTIGTPYATDDCKAWVDWNQNLSFEPAEEVTLSGGPGAGPYTGTVTPPNDAVLGATRMRVRLVDTAFNPTIEPCGMTSYGEVEDYSIVVEASQACEPCDTNCDGSVNGQDISNFIAALGGNPNNCSPCNSDADGNGSVNGQDIDDFVACLGG